VWSSSVAVPTCLSPPRRARRSLAAAVEAVPAVYVGAGSNVEPERNLGRAVEEIGREFPAARFSPWYRNRASGFEGEDFINLVAAFDTPLPVRAVLSRRHAIEMVC